MKQNRWQRSFFAFAVCAAMLATAGCGWNKIHNTTVAVQVSGEDLLFIAAIPRVLPDGTRPDAQRKVLLDEMLQIAGGYTYLEEVTGAWMPPDGSGPVSELNDLLLVRGRPEVGYAIARRLAKDFGQKAPFVITVPTQSIAMFRPRPAPWDETKAAMGDAKPAAAE